MLCLVKKFFLLLDYRSKRKLEIGIYILMVGVCNGLQVFFYSGLESLRLISLKKLDFYCFIVNQSDNSTAFGNGGKGNELFIVFALFCFFFFAMEL